MEKEVINQQNEQDKITENDFEENHELQLDLLSKENEGFRQEIKQLKAENERLKNLENDYEKIHVEYCNLINDGANLHLNKKIGKRDKLLEDAKVFLQCYSVLPCENSRLDQATLKWLKEYEELK